MSPSLSAFDLRVDKKQTAVWHPDFNVALMTLAPKKWESTFFKRQFATLAIDHAFLDSFDTETSNPPLQELLKIADRQKVDLIELSLDSCGFGLIPTLEEVGFRLVDSKVCFFTLIDRRKAERFDPAVGSLAMAQPEDLPIILELTKTAFDPL